MTSITEIAPDIVRISTYDERADMEFAQFLVRDEEPLLYHTGQNALFPRVFEAVKTLIDVERLRWIGFSHFEADETGALARWLAAAPHARPVTGLLGAETTVGDVTDRPLRVLADDDVLVTGRHRLRFLVTPYVPHSWDATLLFDETEGLLFCSDLLAQHGQRPALQDGDKTVADALANLRAGQRGPFRDSIPWTTLTAGTFERLARLEPRVLAPMHGACVKGDGAAMLRAYATGLTALHHAPGV